MSLLLLHSVKITAILAIALVALACLRRRSAAVRHATLLAALVSAAALPLLQPLTPAWTLSAFRQVPASPGAMEFLAVEPDAMASLPVLPNSGARGTEHIAALVARLVVPVWLAGAGAGLALLLLAILRLRRTERGSIPVTDGAWSDAAVAIAREYGVSAPRLLLTPHPALLFTWGWRARVLLPSDAHGWSQTRIHLVLRHELAHIRRRDWITQMLGELLRVVCWFNPVVWIACRRLRQESEQACDDYVLRSGVEPSAYAAELLDIARAFGRHAHPWAPVPAAARPSTLHRRIRAMLVPNPDLRPAGFPAAAAALALLIVTLAASGFDARASIAGDGGAPAFTAAAAAPSASGDVAIPAAPDERVAVSGVAVNDVFATPPVPAGDDASPASPQPGAAQTGRIPEAQTAPATFSGIIVDPSGGALPGVRVTLSRVRPGEREERSATTAASGAFRLTEVPPGEHELQLTLPGFAPVARRVSFAPGANAHLELMMRVGALQETVTIGRTLPEPGAVSAAQNRALQAIREALARAEDEPVTAPEGLIAPRTPDRPIRVGGHVQAPRKITDVQPAHPVLGLAAYGGVVALQARIGADGRIQSVFPLWSSNEQLADAASAAVAQWEFTPTRLNGRPVAVDMFVTVHFTGA